MLHISSALLVLLFSVQSIAAPGPMHTSSEDTSHEASSDIIQSISDSTSSSILPAWTSFATSTSLVSTKTINNSTVSTLTSGHGTSTLPSNSGTVLPGQASSGNRVVYDWSIDWVTASPDGIARPVIGVNGQWPCPAIDVTQGDLVIVNVYNNLGNQSTSLHWHGIHQRGTTHMDGSAGVSQCPIPPGSSFTYEWTADQAGTYWWHSHAMGQYPDGLWGPLIVRDPNPPFKYDEEIIMTVSDWYNEQMPYLINQYQSAAGEAEDGTPNPSGGALINSGKNVSIHVKPSTTYLVRIICPAAFSGHGWVFDGHDQTTVEVDGVYTTPVLVTAGDKKVRIAPGQRQSVLVTTKNDTSKNYAILDFQDPNMLFLNKGKIPPADYPLNTTGWLVYNTSAAYPDPPVLYDLGNDAFYDDLAYTPLDQQPVLEPVDHQLILDTNIDNITGISRFTMNGYTYLGANVPSVYTALTVDKNDIINPIVYGNVNPFVFKYNEVVEVVINNLHTNLHPMHLHGHQFQILERTIPKTGKWPGTYSNYSRTPVRRDTIMLQNEAYAVIRFRADNPGFWLFHCHIEFHVESGFSATFIEAPEMLGNTTIPQNHIDACKAYPMDYSGNAAGNEVNALNLTGAPSVVPTVQWGARYPPVDSQVSG